MDAESNQQTGDSENRSRKRKQKKKRKAEKLGAGNDDGALVSRFMCAVLLLCKVMFFGKASAIVTMIFSSIYQKCSRLQNSYLFRNGFLFVCSCSESITFVNTKQWNQLLKCCFDMVLGCNRYAFREIILCTFCTKLHYITTCWEWHKLVKRFIMLHSSRKRQRHLPSNVNFSYICSLVLSNQ